MSTNITKIPSLCVVFGCSNTPDPKSGIILHKIPCDGNSRPEAIKRRKRWVDFVKRKHAKLELSKFKLDILEASGGWTRLFAK